MQDQNQGQKCVNETDHDEFAKTFPQGPTGGCFAVKDVNGLDMLDSGSGKHTQFL